jgi:hypothetical protein
MHFFALKCYQSDTTVISIKKKVKKQIRTVQTAPSGVLVPLLWFVSRKSSTPALPHTARHHYQPYIVSKLIVKMTHCTIFVFVIVLSISAGNAK